MPSLASALRRGLAPMAGLVAMVALSGCSGSAPAGPAPDVQVVQAVADPSAVTLPSRPAVRLGAMKAPRLRPDVLVTRRTPLSPAELRRVSALAPAAVAYAAGTVQVQGQQVRVAAVDPATFRRFAASGTAEATPIWQVIASGELLASHELAKRLSLPLGDTVAVRGAVPLVLRLGGLATTGVPGTDLVVDLATGRELGLSSPTAVLLSAGRQDVPLLAKKVRQAAGATAQVELLNGPSFGPTAFLTGGAAARALGAFSYRYYPDGTIEPDAAWVRRSIVTARMPIFGSVACHRLMVPQLRAALQEVVAAGLSSSLRTYNGCYVPRFIERDPSRSISLHTWGIAIDFDAATNYRGVKGTMDPRVVAIFKRWGFRWGGDWSYSDPMHFELGALMTPRR